jgi:uncharacterized protein
MQSRFYRDWVKGCEGVNFQVQVEETDLFISAESDIKAEAYNCVREQRGLLKEYIEHDLSFLRSLKPVQVEDQAPLIVKEMAKAAIVAGVGPMAAVAGAMAEAVGRELGKLSRNIIVENGGDIYIDSTLNPVVALYAGRSSISGKIGLKLKKDAMPLGVCTSSASIGHSLNFGNTDALTVIADSASVADALATAISNIVKSPSDIESALKYAQKIDLIKGLVIIVEKRAAFYGDIEIVKL